MYGMSFRRKPESRAINLLQKHWTPVFTGVTIFAIASYKREKNK
jgi:hypothetical protein